MQGSLVSNDCEAAQISLVWAPNGLNELLKEHFKFPFILIEEKKEIACLPRKHIGVHMNLFKHVRVFQIELEFGSVGF